MQCYCRTWAIELELIFIGQWFVYRMDGQKGFIQFSELCSFYTSYLEVKPNAWVWGLKDGEVLKKLAILIAVLT